MTRRETGPAGAPAGMIGRLSRLSRSRRRALAIAVLELLRARLRLAAVSSAECLAALRRPAPSARPGPGQVGSSEAVAEISWAIAAAAGRVPWRADCLVQAMAADRWLRRRALVPEFRLGVRRDERGALRAHAWVRCGETTVTGAGPQDFSILIEPPPQR